MRAGEGPRAREKASAGAAAPAQADARAADARLSADQRFMLAHAIRSYYGSTQLLERDGQPLWVVNEGEYRMMNTFDLTVDHLFFELRFNPWPKKPPTGRPCAW